MVKIVDKFYSNSLNFNSSRCLEFFYNSDPQSIGIYIVNYHKLKPECSNKFSVNFCVQIQSHEHKFERNLNKIDYAIGWESYIGLVQLLDPKNKYINNEALTLNFEVVLLIN